MTLGIFSPDESGYWMSPRDVAEDLEQLLAKVPESEVEARRLIQSYIKQMKARENAAS